MQSDLSFPNGAMSYDMVRRISSWVAEYLWLKKNLPPNPKIKPQQMYYTYSWDYWSQQIFPMLSAKHWIPRSTDSKQNWTGVLRPNTVTKSSICYVYCTRKRFSTLICDSTLDIKSCCIPKLTSKWKWRNKKKKKTVWLHLVFAKKILLHVVYFIFLVLMTDIYKLNSDE